MKALTSNDLMDIGNVVAQLDSISSKIDASFTGVLYAIGASFRIEWTETPTGYRHTVTFKSDQAIPADMPPQYRDCD